jgi:hypothetical protein
MFMPKQYINMKKQNKSLTLPALYRDKKEGHIHFVFTEGTIVGDPLGKTKEGDRFLFSQIVVFDEQLSKAILSKEVHYLPYETFVSKLENGSSRFASISKKEQSRWPEWKKRFWSVPGVLFEEDVLINEISRLQYVKISSYVRALGKELAEQAKQDSKKGRLHLASSLNKATEALAAAGKHLADAAVIGRL